ncbi:ThuA domain-containing protein [Cerasicoccus arenae]|uniref:Trehalose utilization protein ThuA n=1 Tax=Cerasicoccus arenae TaxID=424488 RepID=A0A8J3DGD3_9BACT|nr:ThuA domain-containing protein [Cerasicoccus arenae]MBK1857559.1 ThuA domain-containing protein [Cerasicoccus arenae]GHB95738.1 trehalose utilization protein ThuA [Cerasicoccus arenae]
MPKLRVTIWNEFVHEKKNATVKSIYPDGIHAVIAEGLKELGADEFEITIATLDMPEHGLTEEVLASTDVLIWWGHCAHGQVEDVIVDRVQARVLQGMGFIVLHSGHFAKPFKRLMGTSCALKWREAGEKERLWVCNPGHPIAAGIEDGVIELDQTEMYGEPFGIPAPDEQVFISWFEGGEVFRSGNCWIRGNGKIFYFRPGHETYPIYHNTTIRRVIYNAVKWAAPQGWWEGVMKAPNVPADKAPEPIKAKGKSIHEAGQEGFH